MMKNLNLKYPTAIIALLLIFSCAENKKDNESRTDYLPFYKEATFTPMWLKPNSKEAKSTHKIPPFELTNQNGETVTEKTFDDRIYVTNFFFTTCPGICPRMTANMSKIQEAFKNDDEILLLSHSVTPKKDSVSVLKSYAENQGVISGKWHLVTGKRETIYNLGRHSYFVEEDLGLEKSNDDFLHTENIILIDKSKNIRGIYNGLNKTSINQLITDIKTLKIEM